MSILSARGLGKAFGVQTLFSGISLTVRAHERVGLLGRNGAGKSTLLRVLAGVEPPDEGVIETQRGAQAFYVPQEPKLTAAATPRQIVEEGLSGWYSATSRHAEVTAQIEAGSHAQALLEEQAQLSERIEQLGGWTQGHLAIEMLERMGVFDIDREVGSMSGGEQRRVALAKLLVASPQIALLDEPTNHLDVETIEYLEEYLADKFAGAVLLITHDRYVLDAVCDRIVELEDTKLTEYTGGYSEYLEQKAEQLAHAERHEDNRLNRLRRERAWLARGPKARSTKQKARIKRAEALMAAEPAARVGQAQLSDLGVGGTHGGKTILEFHDLVMHLGERTLINKLTMHMTQGERLGIVGPNGAGKTTLLKLVSQELTPTQGSVKLGANSVIAYFDQSRSNLRDDWSVFDNVAERQGAERDGGGRVQLGEQMMDLRNYLERFLFDGAKQRQKVGALSGGERARVALAKTLRGGANMLLLDEPTNDLDIATLGELEELLIGWPGCALIVSHDRAFLSRVATAILAFEGDGKLVRYAGNYDDYRSQREANAVLERSQKAGAAAAKKSAPPPPTAAAGKSKQQLVTAGKPLSYAERLELDGILEKIGAAEVKVAELEAQLANPQSYAKNPDGARALHADYDKAKASVERLTDRWEQLEARPKTAR